jgi:multicomponent Na+:H+ antiporter subunit D
MGLMPFNLWMIKSYSSTNIGNLTLLAGISSITNFYILIKFTDFIFDKNLIFNSNIILYLALMALLIFSYLAYCANKFRTIIIYSSFASLSYGLLIYIYSTDYLIFKHLAADALSKCALFAIIFELESRNLFNIKDTKNIFYDKIFLILVSITLVNSASMPLTINFINKINLMQYLWNNFAIMSLSSVIISSFFAFLYNYRIFESLYIKNSNDDVIKIQANSKIISTLIITNILGLVLMFLPI